MSDHERRVPCYYEASMDRSIDFSKQILVEVDQPIFSKKEKKMIQPKHSTELLPVIMTSS